MRLPVLAFLAAVACGDGPAPSAAPIAKLPEAPENCYAPSGNICMTLPSISVTCVAGATGAGMTCGANVHMTIPTLVTSGKISVVVGITAEDNITATIDSVPLAPPGPISALVHSQAVSGGCIAGVASRIVNVYDGNYPSSQRNGGRPLFSESVLTMISCTRPVAAR